MVIPRGYSQVVLRPDDAAPAVLHADALAALERFERVLMGRRLARATVHAYGALARRWLVYGGAADRLDGALAAAWLGDQRRAGLAAASINMAIKALRAFYRAMATVGAAPDGEERKLPALRRPPQRLVRVLSDAQAERLLRQPDPSTFAGARDAVMLRTLWESGLRASELVQLECGDVLDDALYVAHGKGDRSRYVPVSTELVRLLRAYMVLRATTRPGKVGALWVSVHGRPLRSRRSVWAIVAHYSRAALGNAVGYHQVRRAPRQKPWTGQYPHMLRASFATTLLRHGCPLPAIMQMLGHSSLDSTARYLGVDIAQLRDAAALHPRARRLER